MNNNLQLVTSRDFNGFTLNCYQKSGQVDPQDFWAIREQIGQALGYAYPREAISEIHGQNKERLDKFSSEVHLTSEVGIWTTIVYNFKGLLEICRYSQQENVEKVIDVLWDIADEIRRTGKYSIKPEVENPSEFQQQQLNLECARFLQHMIDVPAFPLTDESKAVIQHEVFKMLTGRECLTMLPKLSEEWYYSAEDIGRKIGISACKVEREANQHNMKPPIGQSNYFGKWIVSKSKYSSKECPQFIYSQHALDWFKRFIG